jgi:hypothetical protein
MQFVQVTYDNLGQKFTWHYMEFTWTYLGFKKYRRCAVELNSFLWRK